MRIAPADEPDAMTIMPSSMLLICDVKYCNEGRWEERDQKCSNRAPPVPCLLVPGIYCPRERSNRTALIN
jgi:hypothetical protein